MNVDGGGIRGLSSLLILKDLMKYVNEEISSHGTAGQVHENVHPHDIFSLVAGTSTGGLIAIMLGKLGMTVDECILEYNSLASNIFGKKHLRARLNGGLAPAKYSGSRLRQCIRDLLRNRNLDQDLKLSPSNHPDRIPW